MTTGVYANGREIACRASAGQSIAQFPDVCLSPPTAPPTPAGAPLPYPNTAKASDCAGGSKQVEIRGQPVMLADHSYIRVSTGDEAGSAPGHNLITGVTRGRAYFASWSMNVKVEGQGVPRHLDLTTHAHASQPSGGGPWHYLSVHAAPTGSPNMARCTLVRYKDGCEGKGPKRTTPHHCVPDHCFKQPGKSGSYYPGAVLRKDGLCICVEGTRRDTHKLTGEPITHHDYATWRQHYHALAEHGRIHAKFDELERMLGAQGKPRGTASLGALEAAAAEVIAEVTGCDRAALEQQLRSYHESQGLGPTTKLRAGPGRGAAGPPSGLLGVPASKLAPGKARG